MTRLLLLAALSLSAVCLAPAAAAAQNVCTLVRQTGTWTSTGAEGQRVINASGPLLIQCTAGEELQADSAVLYEAIDEVHLFRRVDYQDPGRALTSDYATYNSRTGRLWATGSVVFTDRVRGSTLRGPNLEYYRPVEGRPEPQAVATDRPHLTIVPSSGRQRRPMEVDADRISTVGERYMTADGNVVIEGDGLDAWAEQAFYDATEERLELRRRARAQGERFELTGDFIQAELDDGSLREVLSRGAARLVEERLRVTGPQIRMFFERDSLQRLVSGHAPTAAEGGAGRSVALASGFRMEADSLEARTPGQRIREVVAIGEARGEAWDTARVAGPGTAGGAAPDSAMGAALGERDLVFADTILGFFRDDTAAVVEPDAEAPAAAPAGEREAEIERVLAMGNARSLYRLTPSREDRADPDARRGINYVIGDTIDLAFLDGEVDVATVRGMKKGVYLDPVQAAAPPAGGAPAGPPAPAEPEAETPRPEDPPPPPAAAPPGATAGRR